MQRRTRDNTKPQSQYCGTAPYSLRSRQRRQCTPKTRIVHRAYDAATMLHIFAGPTRTTTHMPTGATLPDTITPQTRAHRHTRCDNPNHHNTTSASWRVSPKTAHACNPCNAHRTLACRIQTHKPRTPARRPQQPQPLPTAQSSPHAHRHAHATHSTAHSSNHPTRRPQKITPSHTRHTHCRAVRLPTVDGMLPESWLLYNPKVLQNTNSHRVTPWQTTPSPTPTTHRSASHSLNQIKSSDSQSAHCMLSLTHNTVCE